MCQHAAPFGIIKSFKCIIKKELFFAFGQFENLPVTYVGIYVFYLLIFYFYLGFFF